jgi:hypothetical protein
MFQGKEKGQKTWSSLPRLSASEHNSCSPGTSQKAGLSQGRNQAFGHTLRRSLATGKSWTLFVYFLFYFSFFMHIFKHIFSYSFFHCVYIYIYIYIYIYTHTQSHRFFHLFFTQSHKFYMFSCQHICWTTYIANQVSSSKPINEFMYIYQEW